MIFIPSLYSTVCFWNIDDHMLMKIWPFQEYSIFLVFLCKIYWSLPEIIRNIYYDAFVVAIPYVEHIRLIYNHLIFDYRMTEGWNIKA